MAEWLRPGLWEVLMLSRGIEPGQVLIPKKSILDVALVSITSAIHMAGVSQILNKMQQDGRVVKAPSYGGERTKYTPDMPGLNPAAKNVHRGGLVPSHVPL